jgi:O-antigen/teichoic acid export membrane protein
VNRNFALARSIVFGAATKLAGSGMILIGLPLIANALPGSDYAVFLASMSASSFVTLWFGATVSLSVRELAHAISTGDDSLIKEAESNAAGLFVVSVVSSGLIALTALALTSHPGPQRDVFLFVDCLALVHGLMLWNDAYRLALRSDHVSSMWQLGGSVFTITGLVFAAPYGLWPIVLVYFGGPFLTQICMLTHLWFERRFSIKIDLSLRIATSHLRTLFPLVVNSFAEYGRIFASGFAVAYFIDPVSYAKYATIVLFIARLTNPFSLITRPLMPAFMDALHHRDSRWISIVSNSLIAISIAGAALSIVVGYVVPLRYLTWIVPSKLGSIGRLELIEASLYTWAFSMVSIVSPFYFARNQVKLYSLVNSLSVASGISIGTAALWLGYGNGMLAAMSATSIIAALILITWSITKIFRFNEDLDSKDRLVTI